MPLLNNESERVDPSVTVALLRVGAWCVDPTAGKISRDGETIRVDARVMRLLQYLAERSGQVVSVDELLDRVWSGVVVTPDSVYQAVASLRRTLGDDPRQPTYIANVPRLGYRMVAPVGPWIDPATTEDPAPVSAGELRHVAAPTPNAVHLTAGACCWRAQLSDLRFSPHWRFSSARVRTTKAATPAAAGISASSVAVLAFLDLTEEMDQEYFGDAMTEDLIDQLSKTPGLRVVPAQILVRLQGQTGDGRRDRRRTRGRVRPRRQPARVRLDVACDGTADPRRWRIHRVVAKLRPPAR